MARIWHLKLSRQYLRRKMRTAAPKLEDYWGKLIGKRTSLLDQRELVDNP